MKFYKKYFKFISNKNYKNILYLQIVNIIMPVASKKQCKNPRGFSQIASCKAQGLIARTSKKNKGKYIKSNKYKSRKTRRLRSSISKKKRSYRHL